MLLLARLIDRLCVEDSLIEANVDGSAMVVMSNTGKTAHACAKGKELGSAYEVSMVNLSDNMQVSGLICSDRVFHSV